MKTDIEISQNANLEHITKVANQIGIENEDLEQYGNYKAKVDYSDADIPANHKLILVTSINPTAAGEGKTTLTIGLGDAFKHINKKNVQLP